jgi:tetratricopeptide (TPR) repeat protein
LTSNVELKRRIEERIEQLEQFAFDLHESDQRLEQEKRSIDEIETEMYEYAHVKEEHSQLFEELTRLYQRIWQTLTERILEYWSRDTGPQMIAQFERLTAIAPSLAGVDELVARLRGHAFISQAYQEIDNASLETAIALIDKAYDLLPDDLLIRQVQKEIDECKQRLRDALDQAVAAREQNMLSQAYTDIQTALTYNQESPEAVKLKQEVADLIKEVRALADDAYACQTDQPEEALRLWEEVCTRHRDGTYPPDSEPDALPFTKWRDTVRRRITDSNLSLQQARQALRQLRELLADQPKPQWDAFDTGHQELSHALWAIDLSMRDSQWSDIEQAALLLQRYRNVYQRLEDLLDSEEELSDTQIITDFQEVYAAIQQFDGGTDPDLRNLADVIKASYARMNRLIKYI